MKHNPLKARPPIHHNRLRNETRLTKFGWAEPWIGVHTTVVEDIAVGYAANAVRKNDWETFGVVYTLDVRGLTPEPDVDALLWWYELGGKEQARESLEYGPPDEYDSYQGQSVIDYLISWLPSYVNWESVEDTELLQSALKGNRNATRQLLIEIFPQRRYLSDFHLDRVVEIRSVMPFAWDAFDIYSSSLPQIDAMERLAHVAASGPVQAKSIDKWLMAYGLIEWYDNDKSTGAVDVTDLGTEFIDEQRGQGLMPPGHSSWGKEKAKDLELDFKVFDIEELWQPSFNFRTLWSNPNLKPHHSNEWHGASGVELEASFPDLGIAHDEKIWDWSGPWWSF